MDYLNFFNLKEDPFGLTPDSHYFYPSKMHNDVLATLDYAVEQKEGFSLIIGEPGTGKTTILKIFIDRWKEKAEIALIMTPRLSAEELLQAILDDLNIHLETTNKNEMIKTFRDFLITRSLADKRVIIIVDEAQNLSDGSLEELRLLSNLETEKEKLLQIILVGQPELQRRLHSEGLRQLDQRISIRATLRPLTEVETSDYISFRLIKAGKGSVIFNEKSKKMIHKLSRGIPRLINLTASRAMMVAYIGSSNQILKKHVLDTVKHIPEAQLKSVSRHRILRYAAASSLLISLLFVSFVGYNILLYDNKPQQGATHTGHQNVIAKAPSEKPETLIVPKQEAHATVQRVATVIVNAARVREGPSLHADVAHVVAKGDSFEITDEWTEVSGNRWYKVRLPDEDEYWIASYIVKIGSQR